MVVVGVVLDSRSELIGGIYALNIYELLELVMRILSCAMWYMRNVDMTGTEEWHEKWIGGGHMGEL